jgi:hypothetical protein
MKLSLFDGQIHMVTARFDCGCSRYTWGSSGLARNHTTPSIPHLANDNLEKQQSSHDRLHRAKAAFDSILGAGHDTDEDLATLSMTEHEVIR